LNSPSLIESGLKASIPSTLLFCHGVIRLDIFIFEKEFWEGAEFLTPILEFRRISVRCEDNVLKSIPLIELKFRSSIIPSQINIFKIITKVEPSIRSPVQCQKCLHFGHTANYYCSEERCALCCESEHSYRNCAHREVTDLIYCFCQDLHLSTDNSYAEWSYQKEIIKIMTCNNVSYVDAIQIKKKHIVNPAFKYSNVAAKKPAEYSSFDKVPSPPDFVSFKEFPTISTTDRYKKKPNKIYHSSNFYNDIFTFQQNEEHVSNNGSFFNYVSENRISITYNFAWVPRLANKLVEFIKKSSDNRSSSFMDFNIIIMSFIMNFFSFSAFSKIEKNE